PSQYFKESGGTNPPPCTLLSSFLFELSPLLLLCRSFAFAAHERRSVPGFLRPDCSFCTSNGGRKRCRPMPVFSLTCCSGSACCWWFLMNPGCTPAGWRP